MTSFASRHHYYERFEGRIVGSRGEPLAHRKISLLVDQGSGFKQAQISRLHSDLTDEAGYYDGRVFMAGVRGSGTSVRVRIRLEDALDSDLPHCLGPAVTVVFEEYRGLVEVPVFVVGKKIEPEFSTNVAKGKKLSYGAQIVDGQGRPIKGVRVGLFFKPRKHASATTDEEGRWCAKMRPNCRLSRLQLVHPEYGDTGGNHKNYGDLLGGHGTLTMQRGITVTGIVRNSLGVPLADVVLRLGGRRTVTPDDGAFQIKGVRGGKHMLRVEPRKHAPTRRYVDVEPNMPPLDITLQPGRDYAGRVLDSRGRPLSGVKIEVGTWIDAQGTSRFDFREVVSSADGRFYFSHLPPEGWCILKCRRRDEPIIEVEVPDLGKPEPIVLRHAPVFRGRVLDAQSGEPIKSFTLYNGHKWYEDATAEWNLRRPKQIESPDGSFTHKWYTYSIWHNQSAICLVKLRAEGYLPVVLGPALLGQAPERTLVRLQRGRALSGKLLDPDGQPAAYADVCWVGLGEKAVVSADGFKRQRHENHSQSDAQGQFQLNPVKGPGFIFALHQSGYAQVELDQLPREGSQIRLTPWATVRATVPSYDESASFEIALQPVDYDQTSDSPHILWFTRREYPNTGAFCFNRVPSIPMILGRYHDGLIDGPVHLTPKPGQACVLEINSQGLCATGRIIIPEGMGIPEVKSPMKSGLWASAFCLDGVFSMGRQVKIEPFHWLWKDVDQVYEASKWRSSKRFVPIVRTDGRYELSGLSPGNYEILVNLGPPHVSSRVKSRAQLLALGHTKFTVPENAKQPIRIPPIELSPIRHPKVGDMAPDFAVNVLNGQKIDSANLRGKVVLLGFWDWYSKACIPEYYAHRDIHARFKDNPQFVMLGVSCDPSVDWLQRWIHRRKPPWPQVYEGRLCGSLLARAFGVSSVPANILIGPDGRIMGRDMDAEQLKRTLEQMLSNADRDVRSITNTLGMKLKYIKPGEFWMGSPSNERFRTEREGPRHKVRLSKGFYIGITEVTQGQWRQLMGDLPPIEAVGQTTGTSIDDPNRPVDCVTWIDANEFCSKLSTKAKKVCRLPTEAEWEYACRAGSDTAYCFGDDHRDLEHYAQAHGGGSAQPVSQKKANAWGLFDMHGNVWEWCNDVYEADYYKSLGSYVVDPKGPIRPRQGFGHIHCLRGGDWHSPIGCRSAFRGGLGDKFRNVGIGFRVVLEADWEQEE